MTRQAAINWPTPELETCWKLGDYLTGSTEPWTQQAVAALLVASHQTSVLELGSYLGFTSVWLCHTLQRMGGGTFTAVDIDWSRQVATLGRLSALSVPDVRWQALQGDSLAVLRSLPPRSVGFVWVDDDHTPAHVAAELELLYNPTMPETSKMSPGGLICMHDVCGDGSIPALDGVCVGMHGYTLDFPRIGALGGLGIIQLPKERT